MRFNCANFYLFELLLLLVLLILEVVQIVPIQAVSNFFNNKISFCAMIVFHTMN